MGSEAKVVFELSEFDEAGQGTESLWAFKSEGGSSLVLDNVPILHKGISVGDVVTGRMLAADVYGYERTLTASTNSTVQLIGRSDPKNRRLVEQWLQVLASKGCKFEGGEMSGEWRYGISVPATISLDLVSDYLEVGENAGLWAS